MKIREYKKMLEELAEKLYMIENIEAEFENLKDAMESVESHIDDLKSTIETFTE